MDSVSVQLDCGYTSAVRVGNVMLFVCSLPGNEASILQKL